MFSVSVGLTHSASELPISMSNSPASRRLLTASISFFTISFSSMSSVSAGFTHSASELPISILKISLMPTYESTQKIFGPNSTPAFTSSALSKGKSYAFPL